MALPQGTLAQPVWRIAPMGVTRVYFHGLRDAVARVSSRGVTMTWSLQSMLVSPADLFMLKKDARAEYQRRKRVALARDPHASTNVTTAPEA